MGLIEGFDDGVDGAPISTTASLSILAATDSAYASPGREGGRRAVVGPSEGATVGGQAVGRDGATETGCWFRLSAHPATEFSGITVQLAFADLSSGVVQTGALLVVNQGGMVDLGAGYDDGEQDFVHPPAPIPVNEWTHLTLDRSGLMRAQGPGWDYSVNVRATDPASLGTTPPTVSVYVAEAGLVVDLDDFHDDVDTGPGEPVDSDGDGLTDDEEAILGTNPNNPDTDGDGVSDGTEVSNGTNPFTPPSTAPAASAQPSRSYRRQPPVDVYVDGISVSTIAGWGDLELTMNRRGPVEATWQMNLRPGDRPRALRRTKVPVVVTTGTRRCWSGILAAPDWNAGEFTTIGTARLGEGAECMNPAGEITSKLNTAIDRAIDLGLVPWTRGRDFGNTDLAGPEGAAGVSDPDPGKLNDLLDLWTTANPGYQWWVTPDHVVDGGPQAEGDPKWIALPGVDELGVSDENVTDQVVLRYSDSVDGVYRTAFYPPTAPPGGVQRKASIVHLGPMTLAAATTRAQGMYVRALEGRTGWTNGLLLRPGQVITAGGLWADLSLIWPGQSIQVSGQPDPRYPAADTTFLIDEVTWRPGRRELQVNPTGLVARTWQQVMEEAQAVEGD